MTQSLAGTTIAVGGVELSGFGLSEAMVIDPDGPAFVSGVGVDGTKERFYTGNESFKGTLTLMPGSKSNTVLTAFYEADKESCKAGGDGIKPPFLWKGRGLDLFVAGEFWITQAPQIKVSGGIEVRVWSFETGPGKLYIGA